MASAPRRWMGKWAWALDESLSRSLPDRDEWPAAYPAPAGTKPCTIGEMAREFGTTPRALRFYESKGLLSPQRQGAARLYGRDRARTARSGAQGQAARLHARRNTPDARLRARRVRRLSTSQGGSASTRSSCSKQRKREIETALAELRQHLFLVLRPPRRPAPADLDRCFIWRLDAAYIRPREFAAGGTQPCRATRRPSRTCSSC